MRWVILSLVGLWSLLTVVGYRYILPDQGEDMPIIKAYWVAGDEAALRHPDVADLIRAYRNKLEDSTLADDIADEAPLSAILSLPESQQSEAARLFREAWNERNPLPLTEAPALVWSTDDNPARQSQCALFRAWYLRKYGEPVHIITDPANRDITKTIVQCIAGAGPDIIESYGPEQRQQFVAAGVALDVTEYANENGFGLDTVYDTAIPSIAEDGRQYGFPCNIGYTVLFYHKDMLIEAGLPLLSEPWSFEDLRRVADDLKEDARERNVRRVVMMNLGAWDAALGGGARFFNEDGTACIYNTPATVSALKQYQDLIYKHNVIPSPAEAASMASAGGAAMNATAESASASSLFAAKAAVMITEGRWAYVRLASRNRDRVILPAIRREIADLGDSDPERIALLQSVIDRIGGAGENVLRILTDEQYAAMDSVLTEEDREDLIQLGVAHVPTATGEPYYTANARVAMANRATMHMEQALRFLEFLSSEEYNEQINGTFDSICGMPRYTNDEDGISGPPRPLPGLEAFDSPIFDEAMQYAHPDELSPFIGRSRLGVLTGQVLEWLTNGEIGPAEAARLVEERLDRQMRANLARDQQLREQWERMTGKTFVPNVPLREQINAESLAATGEGAS